MNKKNEKKFILILQITAGMAIVGIVLLVYTRWRNGPSAIFDLLAYVVSIAALVMTTLQSISIAHQVRITEESTNKISDAIEKLESLVDNDKLLTRQLKKDIQLDEQNEANVEKLYSEESQIEQKIDNLVAQLEKLKK